MASLAVITINDGKATPVAHALNPIQSDGHLYVFRENLSGLPIIGQVVVELRLIRGKGPTGLDKVRAKVYLPALETITGQNAQGYTASAKVAYSLQSMHEFFLPQRGTTDQSKDILALSKNLLSNQILIDMIVDRIEPF